KVGSDKVLTNFCVQKILYSVTKPRTLHSLYLVSHSTHNIEVQLF
ncbi:unnamed protein product, partial [Staurois parvus]